MSNSTRMPNADRQDWAQAADKAKEAAASVGEMAGHAAAAVCTMADNAACGVGQRADDLTARAGAGIQSFGDELGRNVAHEGMLGSASQAVARTIRDGGEYLEGAKLSGMTESIARMIRRNPISAVLIAIGLGWIAARKLRN